MNSMVRLGVVGRKRYQAPEQEITGVIPAKDGGYKFCSCTAQVINSVFAAVPYIYGQ